MIVTVYGKPGCGACTATRFALKKAKIPHTYIDVSAPGEDLARAQLKEMGYSSVPVVVAVIGPRENQSQSWTGFHPDKIKALGTHHGGTAA